MSRELTPEDVANFIHLGTALTELVSEESSRE